MTLVDILPTVRQLSSNEKIRLIKILAEEIEQSNDIFDGIAPPYYSLNTPIFAPNASELLLKAMNEQEHR